MPDETSDGESKPKRATVRSVDVKIDQILEEVDGIRIEMSQIKSAIKELVTVLSPDKPKQPSIPEDDFTMFG
ncbi:hypothetical protein N9L01_00060 [bacterium]|nr:hypothetical protein [bacterium]